MAGEADTVFSKAIGCVWSAWALDKKKLNPLPVPGFIQAGATLLTNIHLPNFAKGTLYQAMENTSASGLNCYSCRALPVPAGGGVSGGSGLFQIPLFLLHHRHSHPFRVLLGRFICGFLCRSGGFRSFCTRFPLQAFHQKAKAAALFKVCGAAGHGGAAAIAGGQRAGHGRPFFCKYLCPQGVLEGALPSP